MNKNTSADIQSKLLAASENGVLPCAVALKLASEEKVSPSVIGKMANTLKIKISKCQLGCFK
jgi:hypothetical protein